LFAGLYEAWQKEQGVWETTFTILTTAANALLESYHNRMPVILADRDADDWMDPRAPDPRALKRLLIPAPADLLTATSVSPEVNNVDNDSPDLLQPAGQMSFSPRSG
jgi:putative SOS response-associated peptidase YedK